MVLLDVHRAVFAPREDRIVALTVVAVVVVLVGFVDSVFKLARARVHLDATR